jgi:hypothetical protein
MADLVPVIETMENRWMRAWIGRDLRTLKALTSRKFMLVMGSEPCAILDARSWFEAAGSRYLCSSYRFGDIYVRDLGRTVLFASQLDLQASMDGHDWSGRMWVTDLWRKTPVRRSWRLVQRVVSRPDENPQVPAAIRSLQLWR